jgi:streptogrisin C
MTTKICKVFFSTVVITTFFGAETSTLQAEDNVEVTELSEQEAIEYNLALVAKTAGWTIAQARANYEASEAVGRVAVELASKRPDIFVGSVISEDPYGSPTLLVKGQADQFVYDLVAQEEVKIDILDEQPFSFSELQARKRKVHQALVDMGYQYIATSANILYSGDIMAVVTKQFGLPLQRSDILTFLPEDLRDSTSVIVRDEVIAATDDAYGGMRVTDGGVDECTSGWSLELYTWGASEPWGVTTAGHCSGIDGIRQPGVGIHNFPYFSQHQGDWGDVEVHITNTTIKPKFYSSYSHISNVYSVEAAASISINEWVCMFSRKQMDTFCNQVEDNSMSCKPGSYDLDRLVQMDDREAEGGDSGASWYYATKAYGGHVGYCDSLDVFSVADYFDEALNPTLPAGFAVRVLLKD